MISTKFRRRSRENIKRKLTQTRQYTSLDGLPDNPPDEWSKWLKLLFPSTFTKPFAQRHIDLWQWIESIEENKRPSPSAYIDIEPRGGGKTTTAESAVIRLGAKHTRSFILYVRGTQDKANESISNIAAKLESRRVAKYYPKLSDRKVSKYGHSKGWRVDTLRTASGFNVVGLGLDAAIRGVKLEDYRPDLIIPDDIDDKQDTAKSTAKKIKILTESILPSGAVYCGVLFIQNLIHANSIASQLVENTAEFMMDRNRPIIVHPAVIDLVFEKDKETEKYKIISGTPTWEGQDLDICEYQINLWSPSAFLSESQHEVEETGGIWDDVEFSHCQRQDMPELVRGAFWIDPAVTDTSESDCHGICGGGKGTDGKLYIVHSWEQRTSPHDVIKRGILLCVDWGFETLGVETDQGGDTWISVYNLVCKELLENNEYPQIAHEVDDNGKVTKEFRFPSFKQAKAGSGHGSKVHRNSQMLVDYQLGRVIHVIGTHKALEKSLRRFPKKPLDLADTAYWLWYDMMQRPTIRYSSRNV